MRAQQPSSPPEFQPRSASPEGATSRPPAASWRSSAPRDGRYTPRQDPRRPGASAALDALDDLRLDRAVAGAGLGALDRVDRLHPGDDAAEDRVLAVQPRGLVDGDDEELRAVRVRAGVAHR